MMHGQKKACSIIKDMSGQTKKSFLSVINISFKILVRLIKKIKTTNFQAIQDASKTIAIILFLFKMKV